MYDSAADELIRSIASSATVNREQQCSETENSQVCGSRLCRHGLARGVRRAFASAALTDDDASRG